jgi:ribosomal protein S18 acetylase RimI-like enzyme
MAPGRWLRGLIKPDLEIREISFPQEFLEVYSLWANAGDGVHIGRSDSYEEIQKKLERDPDLFLVAVMSGQIIGTVMGGFDGRRGLMYHLVVHQNYRQQGIGDGLVSTLEERLRQKGCIRYYLLVTKDNQDAIRFYAKRNFQSLDHLLVFGKDIV